MSLKQGEYRNIKQQLRALFEDWSTVLQKEEQAKLIRDGCIDVQQYVQTQPRVVFLVDTPQGMQPKEAMDASLLAIDEHIPSVLHTCAEWVYGILHGFPPYDMVSSDVQKKRYALHSTALCYVYKIPQDAPVDNEKLLLFAERHQMYLQRQLECLAADIIVCCLEWNKKLWRLMIGKESEVIDSGYGISLSRMGSSKVIDFYHPRTQLPGVMTYCLLEKVVNSYAFFKL